MGMGMVADAVAIRNSGDTGSKATYLLVNSDGSINIESLVGTSVIVRPVPVTKGTETATVVSNAQVMLLAANANRRGGLVQNLGASALQVHLTNGTAFGDGALLPQYATFELSQPGGVLMGAIYGIRAAPGTDKAYVLEEV